MTDKAPVDAATLKQLTLHSEEPDACREAFNKWYDRSCECTCHYDDFNCFHRLEPKQMCYESWKKCTAHHESRIKELEAEIEILKRPILSWIE